MNLTTLHKSHNTIFNISQNYYSTIFKTFQSDLDGISNKLGFSKRSFAEWSKQVAVSFTDADGKLKKFSGALKTAFIAPRISEDSWYKNYLGEIVTKNNIDSYIPNLDTNSARVELENLQNIQNEINETKGSWDDYNNQFKNGRKYLLDYAKQNNILEASVDNVKQANQSAREAAIAHNAALKQQTLGAKAATVATKALAVAGNMIAMWTITKGIEIAVNAYDNYVHAQEKAMERSEECTSGYKEEKQSIEDSISKYKELQTKLKDVSLSTDDVASAKQELLSIQDALVEKYGQEVSGLDLINGKYDEQIAKLDEISRKKAKDYVAENYSDIQQDKSYIGDNVSMQQQLDFNAESLDTMSGIYDFSKAGFDIQKYIDKYSKLSLSLYDESGYGLSGIATLDMNGTREEIYQQLSDLFKELSNDFGDSNEYVNNFKGIISNILNTSFDTEKIEAAKNRIKTYTEAEVLSNDETFKLYSDSVTAVENYKRALVSGEGIDEAKAQMEDMRAKTQNMNDIIENSQEVFDEVFNNAEQSVKSTSLAINDLNGDYRDFSSILKESDNKTKSATLADLQSEADTLASIKREMSETGKIGVSSMQSITSQFPEANQELSKYMLGLISEQELFSSLTDIYEQDTKQYLQALVNKNSADAAFFSKVLSNNNALFSELSNAYGFDIQNWTTLAKAKADIESNLIKQLTGVWTDYYSATKDTLTGLYTLTVNEEYDVYDDSNLITPEMEADRVKQLEEYEKYNKIIQSLNDASAAIVAPNFDLTWDTLSGFDEDSFSSQAEAFSEEMNWIERAVNKVSSAYERLKNIVSDTTKNWLSRNSALENSFSVLEDEINTQQQVYRKYTDMFNSYDLDSHYKELISNGTIEIETITDESLKNAIDECIDLYDNAQEAKDAVDELTQEYRSLAMTRFDNLKSEYEAQIGLIEDTVGILEAQLSLLETDGYINSKYLYNSLIEAEKENLKNLNAEYAALSSKINTVEEGSENWYSMKTDINSVSEAIINATDSLKGYENELRQIEWDLFDRTRDDVADLIDESDFLYGILEDKGFYDDGGNLNRYGQAAQAMLAQKYELYASQSKAYADEVKKIDEELAKDPYSTDLIDRRQELIKLQQESVQSALDEKNAMKDLISEGYEEYKNSLDDIISKYKDLLSTIKDTYDYEKNIAGLTDNLAALEKQYQAYQGDNSESGRKNVQQLKTELEDARQDLKETEYEKLISDTEKLLDEFQTDVDEWLNERLDHLDVLISDVISQSNTNTGAIAGTINEAANSVGYTLSDNMNGIWAVYSGNITNALSEIGNEFTSGQSALHDTVKNIGDSVLELLKYADEEAAGLIAEQGSQANGGSDTGSQTEYETNTRENPASGGGNAGGDAGSSDWAIYKYYYPQDLNVDTSVVDRLKSHNIDASFDARSRYWDMLIGDGEYYSTYEQNVRLLNWLKNNRYAKGSRRILFDQLGLTQERGQELIFSKTLGGMITPLRRGDKVFTSEMTENLWKLAQKPVVPDFNLGDTQLPYIGQQNMSNDVNVSFGDVSVTLPNVKNYSDFMREAQKDPDFTKMVQNIALGQAFGKNTYDKYVY